MRRTRGAPPGGLLVDGVGRTRSGKTLVLAFVLALVAALAPSVWSGPVAVAQAEDPNGIAYNQPAQDCGAVGVPNALSGTFRDKSGNPLGGQTVRIRYTANPGGFSTGAISEWYTTTSLPNGVWCFRLGNDFRPALISGAGSQVQFDMPTSLQIGGKNYVAYQIPGDNNFIAGFASADSWNNRRTVGLVSDQTNAHSIRIVYSPHSPFIDPVTGEQITYLPANTNLGQRCSYFTGPSGFRVR